MLNGLCITCELVASSNKSISPIHSIMLSSLTILFQLSFLPLFVSYPRHDLLVSCCLLLPLLYLSLLLVSISFLNVLVSLLKQTLFQPVLEYLICCFLFHLLLQSLIFLFPIVFNLLVFFFLALSFIPFQHCHLFLLLPYLLFRLMMSHLF